MFDEVSETPDSDASTSQTLLERVRLRDPDAWRRFVHLYGPMIYRWACQARLQNHDAADVVQDVFQAVSVNIVRFRRDRPGDSLRGWLRTVTSNKVRDHFRSRRLDAATNSQAVSDAAFVQPEIRDDPYPADELAHRALSLIQTEFEPRTWQAFLDCAVAGRPVVDVARDLNMSITAVYKAKSRVLHRLRRELDGLLD